MGSLLLANVSRISPIIRKTVDIEKLVKEAYYQSVKYEHPYVGTEHLLLSLLKLTKSKDLGKFRLELLKINIFPDATRFSDKEKRSAISETFTENLSRKTIRSFDRVLVDRPEYKSLVSALLLQTSSNILIIGDKGVGKEALIELLAKKVVSLEVPPALIGSQVIEFDLLAFMSGLLNKSNVELSLVSFVDELKNVGKVIVSVKNFQNIFFATTAGFTAPVFYTMFKSKMDSVGIPIIATMDASLYERIISENEHLLGDFTVIELKEPDKEDTIEILKANAASLSDFHNIEISKSVIEYVYEKGEELVGDVKFPQKGVDLLDHACSFLIQERSKVPVNYRKMVDKSFDLLVSMDTEVEKGDYEKALKARARLRKLEGQLM
ncbi:MAG: hypothetical protein PVJ52_03725, partial [Candidatus Woesebacteria bacterium]